MSLARRAPLFVIAALICAPLWSCGASSRDVEVQRYDVALSVLADGSLTVQETVVARALAAGARFERDVPRAEVDEIFDVRASVDGAPLAGATGEAAISRWGTLRVRWAPSTQVKTLKLQYRLAGALAAQETRGLLRRSLFPDNRAYSIAGARVTLAVPHGAIFAFAPSINDARMTPDGSGFAGELQNVGPPQPAIVSAEIDLGSMNMAEPAWQTNAAQAWRLMPAFLAGAACLITIAIGVVVMVRLQYGRTQPASDVDVADLCLAPPGLVSSVVRERLASTGASRFATLLSLWQRGVLPSRAPGDTSLLRHEQAMLDEIWIRQAPNAPISLADSKDIVQRAQRQVDSAIGQDLVNAGLADAGNLAVRRGLRQTGWVAIGMAIASAMAIELLLSRLGIWPMAIPLSLIVMGAVFIAAAGQVAFLSPRGVRAGLFWRERLDALREAASSGRVPAPEFERCLPVMIACGAGPEWAAAWERAAPGTAAERLLLVRQYTSRL